MIKVFGRFLALFSLIVGCFCFTVQPQAQAMDLSFVAHFDSPILAVEGKRRNVGDDKLATEYGSDKIDINNTAINFFTDLKGFYPTLAGKIIDNAPYEKVEDVLDIPGLSEKQIKRLQDNLDRFVATPPSSVYNEGDERYNPAIY